MLRVSFYSYKGGSGRSTTALNTIQRIIAKAKPTAEHPFVIVDADIDSAGITLLLAADKENGDFHADGEYKSLQFRIDPNKDAGLDDGSPRADVNPYFKTMKPVGNAFGQEDKNSVLLIGADKAAKSNAFSLTNRSEIKFREIAGLCKYAGCGGVFFDTPSGTQLLASLSIASSDVIVCCMRPSYQFRSYTASRLKELAEQNKDNEKKFILCPTAVSIAPMVVNGNKYPQAARTAIQEEIVNRSPLGDKLVTDMLLPVPVPEELIKYGGEQLRNSEIFGIPEVGSFKFFESCLGRRPLDKLNPDEKVALDRFDYLAELVIKLQR